PSAKEAGFVDGWGEIREGWFAQPAQATAALDPRKPGRGIAVIGFRGAPHLQDTEGLAERLRAQGLNARVREIDLSLTAAEARRSVFEWATALDSRPERARLAGALKGAARGDDLLLLPPMLGWQPEAFADLSAQLDGRVGETVASQPSVPGLRLARALERAVIDAGCRVVAETATKLAEGRLRLSSGDEVPFDAAVLATGRFVGGGIARRGAFVEPLAALSLGLGLARPFESTEPIENLTGDAPGVPAPAFEVGVRADSDLHPLDAQGRPVPWLWAAGSVIAGLERGLGFAFRTGAAAGRAAAEAARSATRRAAGG